MTNAINFVFFAFFNISDVVTATTFFVSLVMPTVADPVPGWTGNLYGPIGVMAAAGMGIMRVMLADVSVKLDIVPADYVVNALICAAWEVDYKRRHNCAEVSIYNCVGGLDKAVNGGKILCSTINYEYPASNPLWATFLIITRNVYWFTFLTFIFHNIPGYFIDCYMYMAGRKERMYKVYEKVNKLSLVLKHFSTQEYDIRHNNVLALYSRLSEDEKQIFPFERHLNMDQYFADMVLGIKKYIYGESLENAKAEKIYYKRLVIIHYITKYLFLGVCVLVLYKLYSEVFY